MDQQDKQDEGMSSRMELSLGKRLCFGVVLLLLSMAVAAGFLVMGHRRYVRGLDGYRELTSPAYKGPEYPGLLESDVLNLGWAHTKQDHPASSYLLVPKEKRAGVIRIGVFGCSYVQGPEVAAGADVPSQLQQCFREAGFRNVEVINFGVSSYGMHQAYLLWQCLGRDYNLDHVVFFPYLWHQERDRSFIFGNSSYAGVHARYIADGGNLRFVPVVGGNRREASALYFGSLPPWRYVRYDEKWPGLLRLAGTAAVNPFYYHAADRQAEILQSYQLIFNELAKSVPHLVLVANEKEIASLCESVTGANISVLHSQIPGFQDFYVAPLGHASAAGNRLKARELYDFLTGRSRPALNVVEITPSVSRRNSKNEQVELGKWDEVALGIGTNAVACFARRIPGRPAHCLSPVNFSKEAIKGILQVSHDDGLRFAGLPFELQDSARVAVTFNTAGGEHVEIPVAQVRCENGIVGRFNNLRGLPAPVFYAGKDAWVVTLETYPAKVIITGPAGVTAATVWVGTNVWMRGEPTLRGKLVRQGQHWMSRRSEGYVSKYLPAKPLDVLSICAKEGHDFDVDALKDKQGVVDLLLMKGGVIGKRMPLMLDYRVVPLETVPFKRPCVHQIGP